MTSSKALDLLPEAECLPAPEPLGPGRLEGRPRAEGAQRSAGLRPDAGEISFPLRALEVEARLSGPLASVEVRQSFANPFSEPMEAVYIFPLPHGSAVHRFRMKVAGRVVDGVVKERQAAREEYEEGLRLGHRAALLEQERDNVFTVQLGNIPPGEEVEIELAYAGRLEVDEADTTFRFPLVVAPRYIPGDPLDGTSVGRGTEPDTRRVPDASRITPPRLHPGLRTGARLSIRAILDTAGLLPRRLGCSQHATSQRSDEGRLMVELARQDELLDRDFVLRFRLAGEEARPLLLADGGHFLLSLLPPREEKATGAAREVLFLLDHSGSMGGPKMESAKKAVGSFLDLLEEDDRFALVAFDDKVLRYQNGSMLTVRDVPAAQRWLAGIRAEGGTEILRPLQEAMQRTPGPNRVLCVVLITDGQVGNEPEIYRMVQQSGNGARLFTLGIDTAVNDAFLRRVAQVGRGTCELVTPGEGLEEALRRLARETGRPLLVDVELADRGLRPDPDSLAPSRPPDLFAARPSVTLGRKTGEGGLEIRARRPDGSAWSEVVQPTWTDNPALGLVWARERVGALEDRLRLGEGDRQRVEADILALALEYGILTRFTAFVLVDRQEVANPQGRSRTVVQPVESPADWEMCREPAAFAAPAADSLMRCRSFAQTAADYAAAPPPPAGPRQGLVNRMVQSLAGPPKRKQEVRKKATARPGLSKPSPDTPSPVKPKPSRTAEELVRLLREELARHGGGVEDLLKELLDRLAERTGEGDPFPELLLEGRKLAADLHRGEDVAARLGDWLERLERALRGEAADPRDRWWAENV